VTAILDAMHERIRKGRYMGVPSVKCPTDWWAYMEIVHETRPDFIVEVGNLAGGTLLALAHLCDAEDRGRVVGVDIDHGRLHERVRQGHPRISLVTGDASAVAPLVSEIVGNGRCMVIEDSAHTYDNTLSVLRAYAPLVTPGCYLIVEDGIYGHGVEPGPSWQAGAAEAVDTFVMQDGRFERDRVREWPVTWNPGGYLRRKS
jgi:cephalosporin hydroxylase